MNMHYVNKIPDLQTTELQSLLEWARIYVFLSQIYGRVGDLTGTPQGHGVAHSLGLSTGQMGDLEQ